MTLTPNTQITQENVGLTPKGECEKCGCPSGDDWSQCVGSCPISGSPHFRPALSPPAEGEVERDYPAEFEAWWADYKHRNRDLAPYPVKKQIAFDAFYFAARTRTPSPVDWERVGPKLVEFVSDFAAQARVGYGGVPVIRSKRVNVPAAMFHRAVALRDELAAAQLEGK